LKESNENNESGVWDVVGAKEKKNVLVKELDRPKLRQDFVTLFGNFYQTSLALFWDGPQFACHTSRYLKNF
jgi:hypothetical protein